MGTITLTGDLVPPVLLISCVNVFALSVILAFLFDRSAQSLPVVILFHTIANAVQNQVAAVVPDRYIHMIAIPAVLFVCLAIGLAEWGRWTPGLSLPEPKGQQQ
jgi:hypothetical protein